MLGISRFNSLGKPALTTTPSGEYIAVAIWASPYLAIFKKNAGGTWDELIGAVDVMPTNNAYHICWSNDGTVLIVGQQNAPYYNFYYRNGDTFTKFTPTGWDITGSAVWAGWCAAFNPTGTQLAIVNNVTKVNFYTVSGSGSGLTLSYQSQETTWASLLITGVEFSPDNYSIAVSRFKNASGDTADILRVFDRTSTSSFTWTERSVPSTSVTTSYSSSWNNTSTSIAVSHLSTPYITIFNKSGSTITKLSDPPSLPTGNSHHADWNSDGTTLAVTSTSTPYIHLWNRSGDTFTKITGTPTPGGAGVYGLQFSKNSGSIAMADSSGLIVWSRSGNTFTPVTVNQTTSFSAKVPFYLAWYQG